MGSFTYGAVDQSTAAANRAKLEGSGSSLVTLSANQLLQFDQDLTLPSGITLDGQGTTLQDAYSSASGYRVIHTEGTGLGYFLNGSVTGTREFSLSNPSDVTNFAIGQPVFIWTLNGFLSSIGNNRSLNVVTGISSPKLTVNGNPLSSLQTAIKYYTHGVVAGYTRVGQNVFSAPANTFALGDYVFVDEGPSIGNEGRRETRRIIRVAPTYVVLDTGLVRAYSSAVLARISPVKNVTLKNLIIGVSPENATFGQTLIKYCFGWHYDNVTIPGHHTLVSCSDNIYSNCSIAHLYANSCHDITFVNCTFTDSAFFEEGCYNIKFYGCTFLGNISNNTGCERFTMINCKQTVPAFIGIDAPNSFYDNVVQTGGSGGMFFAGGNTTIQNCSSDFVIQAAGGPNYTVRNCTSPHLYLIATGSGVALNCVTSDLQQQGTGWTFIP